MIKIKEKNRCPHCGHVIDKREIALFKGLLKALWRAYDYCLIKGGDKHEFTMQEIKDLLGKNEYARFGDWKNFGGLVYKIKKAHYGLNMERCDKFFRNQLSIPSKIWKDQGNGEMEPCDYRFAREFPGLDQFLNDDLEYQARYKKGDTVEEPNQKKLI
jgi:hypothetical protein